MQTLWCCLASVPRGHLSRTGLRQVGNGRLIGVFPVRRRLRRGKAFLAETFPRVLASSASGPGCSVESAFLLPPGMPFIPGTCRGDWVACGCYLFSEWQVCTHGAWFVLPNVPEFWSFVVGFISCCLHLRVDTCHLWRQYRTPLHGLVCERKEVM